jgi:hypothetical protein
MKKSELKQLIQEVIGELKNNVIKENDENDIIQIRHF